MTDPSELRKLAEAALKDMKERHFHTSLHIAHFATAANPQAILALLDRLEAAEAALATARRDALEEAAKLAKVAWLKTQYGSIADADAMNGMCEELSAAILAKVKP